MSTPSSSRRTRALIVAAGLVLACASSGPDPRRPTAPDGNLPAGWSQEARSGDLLHASSGFRFAALRNGCRRGAPHDYDETGENASVGYDCPSGVWLTLYVYPTSYGDTPEPGEHFRMTVAQALMMNPGGELRRAVELELPLGAQRRPGFSAYLEWLAETQEIGSFVVLIPDEPRFVKVRTSFPLGSTAPPAREAWELTLAVLRSVAGERERRPSAG